MCELCLGFRCLGSAFCIGDWDIGIFKLEFCPEITIKSGQNKELKSAWLISNRTKSEVYSLASGTVCIIIPIEVI
mgnify:CR=1 FL=1